MKAQCPHCGAENEGNAGDLMRCVECKKVFEVGGDSGYNRAAFDTPFQKKPAVKPKEKKCPYCAETIKFEAIKCKFCGEMLGEQPINKIVETPLEETENKGGKTSTGGMIALLFLLLWGISKCDGGSTASSGDSEPVDKVAALFSGWDGSNREMVTAAKAQMKDPSSFEHVETRYSDRGDKVVIKMTFRGKNSFNATVTSKAIGFINPSTRTLTDFSIYK